MSASLLVINAGSSSIKFQLFDVSAGALSRRLKGQLEGIGAQRPHLEAADAEGAALADEYFDAGTVADISAAVGVLQEWLIDQLAGDIPTAIGHRVVHGGPSYAAPVRIDDAVLAELERYVPLAPLHQPTNLAVIKTVRETRPELPQVACFDTAFHRGHGELADRFAIPEALYESGVRRYGFHGLSYEYIAQALPAIAPDIAAGRVIVAHLGSGASLCALDNGRSVDSTMGFSALDGLPMSTRPGELDAGVVLYLMAQQGMSAAELERFLYKECGLKGLSGISKDVRDLEASDAPSARRALDYFAYRTAKSIGALTTVLGGLDALVFTAGVGENAPAVRADICARLACLGVQLDAAANAAGKTDIGAAGSASRVLVVPTDEELMIARHTLALLENLPA